MTETPLSEREQEILRLVATGVSNKEISRDLHISINTVKVHLRNIFTKLEVMSRTEAAMWAVQNGLVTTSNDQTQSETEILPQVPQPSRWIDTIPKRIRPWIVVGLALILIVLGYGISRAIPKPSKTPLSEEMISLIDEAEQSRWKQLTDMPTARAGLAAAAYDNQIYAIAGEGFNGVLGVVERYDPPSDSWETNLASKPVPVADVQAGVIGGKIYIPGGRLANGKVTDILEIYDPRQDSWSIGEPLPKAISAYAMETFEGKLYLFGGWDGKRHLDSVYVYDPSQNNWDEVTPMPTARSYAGAAVAGGKIYVVGGFDGKNGLDVNEEYSPVIDNGIDNPWNSSFNLLNGPYGFGIANAGENIIVFGGVTDSGYETQILEFSFQNAEWTKISTPFQATWSNMSVTALATRIFFIGGKINRTISAHNIAYTAYYTVLLPIIEK